MCPEQSALTPLSGGPQTGRRSRHMYSPLTRSALTIQISRKATKSAQTIMATISVVFRPLGDQKVTGGVLTVAPFICREMDRWPEMRSNHAGTQNEGTIRNFRGEPEDRRDAW